MLAGSAYTSSNSILNSKGIAEPYLFEPEVKHSLHLLWSLMKAPQLKQVKLVYSFDS